MWLVSSGCSFTKEVKQEDPFRTLVTQASNYQQQQKKKSVEVKKMTLSANDMLLSVFCRLISDHFQVGIIFNENLAGKRITAEFKDTDLSTVFTFLSRQLGVDVVRVGNTFYLGELKDEDKGVLIRRVLSHDEQNLNHILDTLKSSQGKGKVISGRILILSDKDFVLRRVTESIDQLESLSLSSWIVQLYFVVLRKDALAEAGFTMSTSGTLSYNISENTIEAKNFSAEGLFSGILESNYADLYASPMFILRDGKKGTWFDGQRVPVPKKSVSDYGTVTTSGFDYVNTGLEVSALVNESRSGAFIQLDISLSDIQSYVEGNPLTSKTSCNIALDLIPNKIYLLSELQRFTVLDRQSESLLFARSKGKSVIQVWGRVYKIKTPLSLEYPKIKESPKNLKNILTTL